LLDSLLQEISYCVAGFTMSQMMPVMEIIMPQQSSGNVPAFLAKLWKMVDNPETDTLITWTEEGSSFVIKNQNLFSRELLPYYYKHSNLSSFVRQLNMYGFHKVLSADSGGLKGEREEMEFAHPYFLRSQEHLLCEIKRKVSMVSKAPASFIPSIKNDKVRDSAVNEVLNEVAVLKDRQEDTDNKLDVMRQENEALWQEVLNLRQKHSQQQKIVNKLIHFLVAVVQPRNMSGLKRRFPVVPGPQLMIEDAPTKPAKEAKLDAAAGPVIQDVTNTDPLISLLEANSPEILQPPTPSVESGDNMKFEGKYRLVDPASVNSALMQGGKVPATTSAVTTSPKRPALQREISKEDFDLDINNMQAELDNLKDLLSGQITLDSSLVSSLFSPEDNLNLNPANLSSLPANISFNADGLINDYPTGDQQLVSYNPSLFELKDDLDDNDERVDMLESLQTPRPEDDGAHPGLNDLNTPLVSEDNTNPLSRF